MTCLGLASFALLAGQGKSSSSTSSSPVRPSSHPTSLYYYPNPTYAVASSRACVYRLRHIPLFSSPLPNAAYSVRPYPSARRPLTNSLCKPIPVHPTAYIARRRNMGLLMGHQ